MKLRRKKQGAQQDQAHTSRIRVKDFTLETKSEQATSSPILLLLPQANHALPDDDDLVEPADHDGGLTSLLRLEATEPPANPCAELPPLSFSTPHPMPSRFVRQPQFRRPRQLPALVPLLGGEDITEGSDLFKQAAAAVQKDRLTAAVSLRFGAEKPASMKMDLWVSVLRLQTVLGKWTHVEQRM